MNAIQTRAAAPLPRFSFKAYACGHGVKLHGRGGVLEAELIDISATGARLRVKGRAAMALGEDLGLNILLDHGDLQSGAAPCRVVWSGGREMEVAFPVRLGLGIAELQDLLDNRGRARDEKGPGRSPARALAWSFSRTR